MLKFFKQIFIWCLVLCCLTGNVAYADEVLSNDVKKLIGTPIAAVFNVDGLETHDVEEFYYKSYEEAKNIIENDIELILNLYLSGEEVYWNPEFLLIMETEYPNLRNLIEDNPSNITVYSASPRAAGSRTISDEIVYYSSIWMLHATSTFKSSWTDSAVITITEASYTQHSDSTPILNCAINRYNNGTTSASVSYTYAFTGDLLLMGTTSYIIKYTPAYGGGYAKEVLFAG